ncbi:mercuric reductase [Desulfocarbo indianensis]|nr:mercuric reductase [Desulfocarbo indianensis]
MTRPDSRHDQKLLANVRPEPWVNPSPQGRYNLVVLGAGTAGLVCAAGAAGLGAKVALVERRFLGGDCLNLGCVPSKALLRSARAVGEIARAESLGLKTAGGVAVDFPAVMERMRRIRAQISAHDSAARFLELGVDVYLGTGRFIGPDALQVDGKTLQFAKAVVATGSSPGGLPFQGLKETGYLTNETVFDLAELPASLAVLGTGPIGCELAQAFQRFGSRVVMVGRSGQIMTREDPEAAQLVAQALVRDGLDLRLETGVNRVAFENGRKALYLQTPNGEERIEAAEILVGAGRKPRVQGLGLQEAGVEFDPKRGVLVDDQLRTSNKNIFAAGDVCLAHKFTHTADAAARIVIQNALFAGSAKLSRLIVPWCTYTDPEVAHVGLYPREIEAQGKKPQTFRVDFAELDRALADDAEGFVKIHVEQGRDAILGATIVAPHAGEMISEVTVAMAGGVGLKTLASIIHPYPTQAEALKRAGDAYNRTRLTPTVQKWMQRWLAWRR